jgi:chitin disaccharide deacetylase
MTTARTLIVVADDFGIGPETSRGILELATQGVVTATALLVNSPYAESAVAAWRAAGRPLDLGWHPNLTLDAPIAPPGEVASLVDADGRMGPLRRFLPRLLLGRVRPEHVRRELLAQFERFRELTGQAPELVNSHQHVALFGSVGAILGDVLARVSPRPFLRRVREPARTLWRIRGSRVKRGGLTLLGRRWAARQEADGFPGADWMMGIADPPQVRDPEFFTRWLACVPGRVVELMCHPGHPDPTLIGRDCGPDDGYLQRRVDEYHLLGHAGFVETCRKVGFRLARVSSLLSRTKEARYVA